MVHCGLVQQACSSDIFDIFPECRGINLGTKLYRDTEKKFLSRQYIHEPAGPAGLSYGTAENIYIYRVSILALSEYHDMI